MSKLFTPKNVIAILFILVIAFIHFFSHNFIDNRASDLFTKMHANFINKSASDNVVLVVIDDKSLKKIPWPWQRNLYSDIFDYLEFYAGAKVIAFQNLVIYPDTYYPENDKYFYSNLAKHNILINSYILSGSNVSGDVLPPEYINAFLEKSNVNILDISQTIVDGFFNMMMICDANSANKEFLTLSEELETLGEKLGCIIKLQREEIFDSMQRI